MTKEELEAAWKDQTWLVDHLGFLVRITSNAMAYSGRVLINDGGGLGLGAWVLGDELRIATAKDLLELGDD